MYSYSKDAGLQPLPSWRGHPHCWPGVPQGLAPSSKAPPSFSVVCGPQREHSSREGKPMDLQEGLTNTCPSFLATSQQIIMGVIGMRDEVTPEN